MRTRSVLAILIVGVILSAAIACGPPLEPVKTPPGTAAPLPAVSETFTVGDEVVIGDFRITVTGTRTSAGAGLFSPAPGHVWFVVECVLENMHATNSQIVSSLMMFGLVDKDGRSMSHALTGDIRGQLDGELGVGRRMTGEIAWEVPVGSRGLELLFKPDLLRAGQAIFRLGDL
ncbi:MAG TPA: DUF4352 domain-containing protein [Bacillota bacterium]|nr:DUF4352 domain-containing protein [Bacillota bacterium]